MEPLADNDSAEGRQINRRVELTIRPLMHLP
jgi:flagellar motor protein MotB